MDGVHGLGLRHVHQRDPIAAIVVTALGGTVAGVGALMGSSASEALGRRAGIPATVAGSRVLEGSRSSP
jgi:hypothetical protein